MYCSLHPLGIRILDVARINSMNLPLLALDVSKAFDTMNMHTLIKMLLQTRIPGTIIKFIKGHKSYTTYRNHISIQRQLKTGVPQSDAFHPLTFRLQTYHHPEHRFRSCLTQMTSPSHLYTQARVQPRNTINHTYIKLLHGQNINLTLNPGKQLCSLQTLQNIRAICILKQTTLHYPWQCTQRFCDLYSQQEAHKTQTYNIYTVHGETLTLPIHEHLQLHASQFKQKTQHPPHPLYKHTTYFNTPKLKRDIKQTCAIYTHQLSLDI